MNRKILSGLILLFAACIFIVMTCAEVSAFYNDETQKIKIDMQLFDEYYGLVQKCFSGAKCEGTIKQLVNGAVVESKFIAYSKDLQYKKIEVTSYGERFSKDLDEKKIDLASHGDKFEMIVTPDKVWYYFSDTKYVIYYAQKKNIAKFNSMAYLNLVKNDGKITKKVSDGQTVYQIIDYSHFIKQTIVSDSATGKVKSQLVETESGEKIEFIFKNWERWNGSDSVFKYPARVNDTKCAD